MARIAKIAWTSEFKSAQEISVASGDNNDCFPKAVALLTGIDLPTVTAAFAEAGRTSGKGTPWAVARVAIDALGFRLEKKAWTWRASMIESYPGIHKNLKNITTRHPVRFKKAWEGQSVLLHSHAHVSAVVNGQMHDWAINRSKHVIDVYSIVAK